MEHPYGIIKRQWNFYYIMTKRSIKHASADVGLIFTAFNFRRIFNIVDLNLLKAYLGTLAALFIRIISEFKRLYDPVSSARIILQLKIHVFLCQLIAYI